MPRVFISYRRGETVYVARMLAEKLEIAFGQNSVSMDVNNSAVGPNDPDHVTNALGCAEILIALIGDQFLVAVNADGVRRLDDPTDSMRREIAFALAHGIPVVPLLVGNSVMPTEKDLPSDLVALAYQCDSRLRAGREFKEDIRSLIVKLRQLRATPKRHCFVQEFATSSKGCVEGARAKSAAFVTQPDSSSPILARGTSTLANANSSRNDSVGFVKKLWNHYVFKTVCVGGIGLIVLAILAVIALSPEWTTPASTRGVTRSDSAELNPFAGAAINPLSVRPAISELSQKRRLRESDLPAGTNSETSDNSAAGFRSKIVESAPDGATNEESKAVPATLFQTHRDVGTHPGMERNDNGLEMAFCWVPPGQFMMGSPADEPDRIAIREGQVPVTLTQGFWLAKFEVTQGKWFQLMETEPWKRQQYVFASPNYAITYVSWVDATEFCRKLTAQEHAARRIPLNWSYRLPTEAEWEYACRAGTTTAYSFGDKPSRLSDFAWFGGLEEDVIAKSGGHPHEVGRKGANNWGLYDMHGNVWEWCQDWYGDELPGGRDPEVKSTTSIRVLRGGSWDCGASGCRSAIRSGYSPGLTGYYLGFRPALSQSRQ